LAIATGTTMVELMHRGGHSSSVAKVRYQNSTKDRNRINDETRHSKPALKSFHVRAQDSGLIGSLLGRSTVAFVTSFWAPMGTS